jgi:hypothetical protein
VRYAARFERRASDISALGCGFVSLERGPRPGETPRCAPAKRKISKFFQDFSKKNIWISKKSLGENILETSIFNALVRIFLSRRRFSPLVGASRGL